MKNACMNLFVRRTDIVASVAGKGFLQSVTTSHQAQGLQCTKRSMLWDCRNAKHAKPERFKWTYGELKAAKKRWERSFSGYDLKRLGLLALGV